MKVFRKVYMSRSQWRYADMLNERDSGHRRSFASLKIREKAGLVSIVLPVFNGERFIAEAIDSVLTQSYRDWELIVVDDGSTDGTARIVQTCAGNDPRIRYYRQENQKLPAALNRGHHMARGEYITWTSDDNRLRPSFLQVLVHEMQVRPDVDMLYGNYAIIDERGKLCRDNPHWGPAQIPSGSGYIHTFDDISKLQKYNIAGAAFLYRRRILPLIGLYSRQWFTCEDYDFFLRVNAQAVLRHTTSQAIIYEYRLHGDSLSANAQALRITDKMNALMVFDDFRWDITRGPMAWQIHAGPGAAAERAADQWRRRALARHDYVVNTNDENTVWPIPEVFLHVAAEPEEAGTPPSGVADDNVCAVFMCAGEVNAPAQIDSRWDLCLCGADNTADMTQIGLSKAWIAADPDGLALWHAVRAKAASHYLAMREQELFDTALPPLEVSVVICTNRNVDFLCRAVDSLLTQTLAKDRFEIIVVNNAPETLGAVEMQAVWAITRPEGGPRIRIINCPSRGLSYARNAGLRMSQGRIVLYVDDDVVAENKLLESLVSAYDREPGAGVIGGDITLQSPNPMPWWYDRSLAKYWSEFKPERDAFYTCDTWTAYPYGANWSARRNALRGIGGFQSLYGRGSRGVPAGEEQVAAISIRKCGFLVAVEPDAKVTHHVDSNRFRLRVFLNMGRGTCATMLRMTQEQRIPPMIRFHTSFARAAQRLFRAVSPFPRKMAVRFEELMLAMGLLHALYLLLGLELERFGIAPNSRRR